MMWFIFVHFDVRSQAIVTKPAPHMAEAFSLHQTIIEIVLIEILSIQNTTIVQFLKSIGATTPTKISTVADIRTQYCNLYRIRILRTRIRNGAFGLRTY